MTLKTIEKFLSLLDIDRSWITGEQMFNLILLLVQKEKRTLNLSSEEPIDTILNIFIREIECGSFRVITEQDILEIIDD